MHICIGSTLSRSFLFLSLFLLHTTGPRQVKTLRERRERLYTQSIGKGLSLSRELWTRVTKVEICDMRNGYICTRLPSNSVFSVLGGSTSSDRVATLVISCVRETGKRSLLEIRAREGKETRKQSVSERVGRPLSDHSLPPSLSASSPWFMRCSV